ncbi:RIO-type serine/threonine-protein kinase Rio1 [Candidatus Methanobinarius endosymbioticus]|uniref:non-specific serine/threonine protein kinase n=1 Tax=Candidatus Methanobinarius endosymbioticus TaxID=2006182 RepID=A0A366MAA8_9EURY|nr:RIO-type serine/threonine-protein kinase Rio1 [Candidatus Methanobinarius endosymbioticus]
MDPKIAKADEEVQKLISKKRNKSVEDRRVGSEIFDKQTLETLYKLANQGYINVLNGAISTGKEANVLKAVKKDDSFVAVKLYRIATSDFKKMQYYIQGDPRFNIKSNNKRQLINNWVNKEFRNLSRLYEAKVNVPKPIIALNNSLLLEFIGDSEGNPAQIVKNQKPENVDEFFNDLLIELNKFINDANLIHGDLSTFNILNKDNYPLIIDVSQSVVRDHPIADELLIRDIKNIYHEFKKLGSSFSLDTIKNKLDIDLDID